LPVIPPRKAGIVTPDNLSLSIAAETFIDLIRQMEKKNRMKTNSHAKPRRHEEKSSPAFSIRNCPLEYYWELNRTLS
jgi:hypothetical protein